MNAACDFHLPVHAVACRNLWVSVLKEQLRCAFGIFGATPAINQVSQRALLQRQARDWVRSRDFTVVCELAGFEPAVVRDWYRRERSSATPGATLKRGFLT